MQKNRRSMNQILFSYLAFHIQTYQTAATLSFKSGSAESLPISPFNASCSRHHNIVLGLPSIHVRRIEDLARIQQPVRIESLFNAAHHIYGIDAELLDKGLFLTKSNSVLALGKYLVSSRVKSS